MVILTLDKVEHIESRINTLSINDVAWLLGMDSEAVQRWVDSGIIKTCHTTCRSNRRFRRDDIAHFLDRLGV